MPIAYCVRSAPVNSVSVSEVQYTIIQPGGVLFGDANNVVGANTDKTPRSLGWNIQYDISAIPLGVTVSRAKIVLTASRGDSATFTPAILRFRDGSAPNVTSVTEAIHNQFKWLARARDTVSTELVVTSTVATFDNVLSVSTRGSDSAGQVLTLATAGNGSLGSVSMWMRRFGFGSYPGTCVAKVYTAAGASGFYTKGSLLATSDPRNTTDITTVGFGAEFVFTFSAPPPVTNGQIMIVEVSFSPAPTGGNPIFVTGDTGFVNPADNALMFGPSMQAFDLAVYMNGVEQAFTVGDITGGEPFMFPTFVDGVQYELGDSLYSPDVVLSLFTGWVQDGLDGRGSDQRLGFGFSPNPFGSDPPMIGEQRQWRSGDHPTPQIVDGNSLFGTVLVVQYDAELAAELTMSVSVDGLLDVVKAAIGRIVQLADPALPAGVVAAISDAVLADVTTAVQIRSALKTVTIHEAALVAQIQAAILDVRITDPELSIEVATAIIVAALADATTIVQPDAAPQAVLVHPASLVVQVRAATLGAEVRAATLATRVPISPDSGPATEENVADLLDISPAEVAVEVTRRDSTPFSFTLQDEDGTEINITGYTSFTLTVDPSEEPSDATGNLFQITAAFPNPLTGVITFSPSIANHTQDPGDYFFDVEQIDDSSNVRTIIKGKYTILADITQP